ncbi:SGNH/GDSL hydrolase family protein [bacterium]|nr:SGNH/GDSL hydrolase family protein [candidate division CSSED10-310 bacterium]
MRRNIPFSLIAIVLFFVGLEAVLRLSGFESKREATNLPLIIQQCNDGLEQNPNQANWFESSDAGLVFWESSRRYIWKLSPGWQGWYRNHTVEINSMGFRGPEPGDLSGKKVIVCLGDSVTFGTGVDYAETYPAQLERILNSRVPGNRYLTICAGVPGYSSLQGMLWYENEIVNIPHDWVVAAFGFNDNNRRQICDLDQIQTGYSFLPFARACILNLKTAQLIERLSGLTTGGSNNRTRQAEKTLRVSLQEYCMHLLKLRDIAASGGKVLILMDEPTQYAPTSSHHQNLRHFCRKNAILFIGLRSIFSEAGYPKESRESGENSLFHDPYHPNARGYRLIAESVADKIMKLEPAGFNL